MDILKRSYSPATDEDAGSYVPQWQRNARSVYKTGRYFEDARRICAFSLVTRVGTSFNYPSVSRDTRPFGHIRHANP